MNKKINIIYIFVNYVNNNNNKIIFKILKYKNIKIHQLGEKHINI